MSNLAKAIVLIYLSCFCLKAEAQTTDINRSDEKKVILDLDDTIASERSILDKVLRSYFLEQKARKYPSSVVKSPEFSELVEAARTKCPDHPNGIVRSETCLDFVENFLKEQSRTSMEIFGNSRSAHVSVFDPVYTSSFYLHSFLLPEGYFFRTMFYGFPAQRRLKSITKDNYSVFIGQSNLTHKSIAFLTLDGLDAELVLSTLPNGGCSGAMSGSKYRWNETAHRSALLSLKDYARAEATYGRADHHVHFMNAYRKCLQTFRQQIKVSSNYPVNEEVSYSSSRPYYYQPELRGKRSQ